MDAGLADDLERRLAGRLRRRDGGEGGDGIQQSRDQQTGDKAWRRRAPRSKAGNVCS
jgi:hypothetical protein